MEKSVRTVFAPHESEKIIEKSRFLTYSEHVESEEEAKAFLAKIRKMHTKASITAAHGDDLITFNHVSHFSHILPHKRVLHI